MFRFRTCQTQYQKVTMSSIIAGICSNRASGKRIVDRKKRFLKWEVMITGDLLSSERTGLCDFTYLLSCDHGYNIHPLFPHHLPEVMACVWQRPLGSNIVPFLSTYSNLGGKEQKIQSVPKISAVPVPFTQNSEQESPFDKNKSDRTQSLVFPSPFLKPINIKL